MRRFITHFLFLSTTLLHPCWAASNTAVDNIELVNQDGVKFDLNKLKGNYIVLSFIYSRCPMEKVCPLNTKLNKELVEEWKRLPESQRNGFPLQVLSISLDPANDTPEQLKKYGDAQKIDYSMMTLATGNPEAIAKFASQFNVSSTRQEQGVELIHNMRTVVLNPVLIPIAEYRDNEWTPSEMLKKITHAPAWWKWFFLFSAVLAVPGLLLLYFSRKILAKNTEESQPA